ncbi:META domain-containing protein [Streptomyces sp. enrichment culture]|uniref:META domain-containing protein n=1 Tax=Streptomyces sp. enrichment culture TaxID=1795815 RepID=UPI003F575CF7
MDRQKREQATGRTIRRTTGERGRRRTALTAAALLLLPLTAACGTARAGTDSGSAGAEQRIAGVRWDVDSVTAGGTTHRAPSDAHLTVDDGGRAEGNYGCNRLRGRAAFDGDRVTLTIGITLMACPEPVMDFERHLADTLRNQPLTTRADGDRLTLTADDGTSVRLSRAEHAPLRGTRWSIALPGADGRAHLTVDREQGTVSGSTGCNHVSADATVRDGHITLGAPSTTRMMCEGSLMDVEETVLKLFDGRAEYRIEYRNLTLTSDDGVEVPAFAAG